MLVEPADSDTFKKKVNDYADNLVKRKEKTIMQSLFYIVLICWSIIFVFLLITLPFWLFIYWILK